MKLMNRALAGTAGLILLCAGFASAQTEKGRTDEKANQTTMTGCLTKGADQPQHYTFVDQKTGKKMTVTGPADLEKHSANHTVRITGAHTAKVFNVTAVEHVAATCEAKSGASQK